MLAACFPKCGPLVRSPADLQGAGRLTHTGPEISAARKLIRRPDSITWDQQERLDLVVNISWMASKLER